jgi:chaperonin GroES
MNVKPLGDRVLLKSVEEEGEQSVGGIIIPDAAKEKSQEAEVVALGTGKKESDGSVSEFNVKVGDRVMTSKYGGTEVKVEGETYQLVREDDSLAVIG